MSIKWGLVDYPVYKTIAEGGVFGWLSALFLPSLTLALLYLAGYVRITRSYVLESLERGLHPHGEGQGRQGSRA